jgi:hypothetical protein
VPSFFLNRLYYKFKRIRKLDLEGRMNLLLMEEKELVLIEWLVSDSEK